MLTLYVELRRWIPAPQDKHTISQVISRYLVPEAYAARSVCNLPSAHKCGRRATHDL
ncbi:MAG: hypothetical protein AELANPGJ_03625 [Anaerolineae bacterium]|nr:hypothetical protein [Anaerolineae bacterium]